MSRAGQANFQGVEFQIWAGLSLVLQFLNQPGFKEIHLESNDLQDFDVILDSNRRYICEVKCWSRTFAKADLINVFNELNSRDVEVQKDDTIVVIAPKISKELQREVSSARFYKGNLEAFSKWFKDPIEIIEKFAHVEFWETDLSRSADITYSLTAQLVDAIVSPEDLKAIVHRLLIEEFVRGSTLGASITKAGLLKRISEFRESLKERAGFTALDSSKQLEEAKEAALNPDHRFWRDAELTAVSINFSQLLVVIKLLEKRHDLELQKWDKLWKGLLRTHLSHAIVDIFKNNLRAENTPYILEFLEEWIPQIRPYYGHSFQDVEILEIINFLCDSSTSLIPTLLSLLKKFIDSMGFESFFFESRQDLRYAREKLSHCLQSLYNRGNESNRTSIVSFIFENFYLVSDEGEFWDESAPAVYEILRAHLAGKSKESSEAFESEFHNYIKSIVAQFEQNSWSKFRIKFKGWEAIGGSSAWWGDNYQVWDRHIIGATIVPSLLAYYSDHPNEAVKLVSQFAALTDKQISKNRPDFLRRATIPVLIQEYSSNKAGMKEQCYASLIALLRSKRGIPSKYDLIFQSIGGKAYVELRERLLKQITRRKRAWANPFIFKQVVAFATSGAKWATKLVSKWLSEQRFGDDFFGTGPLPLIRVILNSDISEGMKALKRVIESTYFSEHVKSFHVYDWCGLVAEVFMLNPGVGVEFLRELIAKPSLSVSNQTLLLGTIGKLASNDTSSFELLELVLNEVVIPLYEKCHWSQANLSSFISESHLREEILELCQKLIQKRGSKQVNLEQILRLFQLASTDISPSPEESKDELDSGRMVSIRTGRGRCAWCLQALLIPAARGHFPEIIEIIRRLLNDPSAYVQRMACFPLSVLLNRRSQTVTEDGLPVLDQDLEAALNLKNKIEDLAENFIISTSQTAPKGLLMGLADVINSMRLVPNESAKRIWQRFDSLPSEIKAERLGFGVFQAEFRRRSYSIPSIANNPLLETIRNEKDESSWFQEELYSICDNGSDEEKGKLSWLIMKLTDKEEIEEEEKEQPDQDYKYEVTFRYFNRIAKSYSKSSFLYIYMFIQHSLSDRFDSCVSLYKKSLQEEKRAITQLSNDKDPNVTRDLMWAPFAFNGDIILSIAESGKVEEALDLIDLLLSYPVGIRIGLGDRLLQYLKNLNQPYNRIKDIFDKLVLRDPLKHTDREEWMIRFPIPNIGMGT